MLGRTIRLVAATAALTFGSLSAASAGWYNSGYGYGSGCCGAPVAVNWGCASAGCAPIAMNWCGGGCAPVQWGCGSSCGWGGGYGGGYYGARIAGYGAGYGYPYVGGGYYNPVHVAYQGPVYDPPRVGYTYPAYGIRRAVVGGYGYRGFARPYAARRVAWRGGYGPRVWAPRRPAWWGK